MAKMFPWVMHSNNPRHRPAGTGWSCDASVIVKEIRNVHANKQSTPDCNKPELEHMFTVKSLILT